MKTDKRDVVIQRLDEWRYAVAVDGLVRYVGSQVECERRVVMLAPKNDRAAQDQALLRLAHLSRWQSTGVLLGNGRGSYESVR
jgi:SH3-like domain-containing protein